MADSNMVQFEPPAGYSFNRDAWYMKMYYGICKRKPYAQEGLGFVRIPSGASGGMDKESPAYQFCYPKIETTFLVPKELATEVRVRMLGRDTERWENHAKYTFKGPWCDYMECLWKDVPVHKTVLEDGTLVKYGFCRRQSRLQPNRPLWFVSLKKSEKGQASVTYVVDEKCTSPDVFSLIGSRLDWWEQICFGKLWSEVNWDTLGQEGDISIVRTNDSFSLDSPFIPETIEELDERLDAYRAQRKRR